MDKLEKQKCPVCFKDNATLTEEETEIPYFGKVFVFSLKCENKECNYHMSDVECEEAKEPSRYTIEVNSDKDMCIRVVKSSSGVVKIPQLKVSIEPGLASIGYVTNIEGVLSRVKKILETTRDQEEELEAKKKAKNMIKKLQKVMWGNEKLKIFIEDPKGNSAIISDKDVKTKIKLQGAGEP